MTKVLIKKSFDAVVFDVLKVTPEEYAGKPLHLSFQFLHIIAYGYYSIRICRPNRDV